MIASVNTYKFEWPADDTLKLIARNNNNKQKFL